MHFECQSSDQEINDVVEEETQKLFDEQYMSLL